MEDTQAGKFDLAICGITVPEARQEQALIYEPFTHGELGVLMPKGSEDLLEYVNAFLEEEKASGRIDELAEEYIYRYISGDQEEELSPAA